VQEVEIVKPFLRWAGSKRKLLPTLCEYWGSEFGVYHEPFLGSGSLFFAIGPEVAYLSDTNEDLINAFLCVRDFPREVYSRLRKIPTDEKEYYRIRGLYGFSKRAGEITRAARFIYLNKYCFNGIYRTNSSGIFNVPYSGSRVGNLISLEDFLVISQRLKNADIVVSDFGKALSSNVKARLGTLCIWIRHIM
jgi:DNA adenine methylase